MRRLRSISLLVMLMAAVSTSPLWTAPDQSLHFPVPAPGGVDPGLDDMQVGIKAAGLSPTTGPSINLAGGDLAMTVAAKAARSLCIGAYADGKMGCTRALPAAVCAGSACCDVLITPPTQFVLDCVANGSSKGFEVALLPAGADNFKINAIPFGSGNISHVTANSNTYPNVGIDIAPHSLIQLRPNGLTGSIQLRIFHTQGGTNPRVATVTVDATNNDPGESLALHNAARTALQGITPALAPAIVATVHDVNDADYPLTAFGYLKQASHFVDIGNIPTVGITRVDVVVPAGMGFTSEGSDNAIDVGDGTVPTLSGWGAITAAAVLLLMIFWLHRKRMRLQQAA